MVVIRVRLHIVATSDLDRLQKFCIYLMERGRKMLVPPQETVTVLFDMTSFGLANMVLSFFYLNW